MSLSQLLLQFIHYQNRFQNRFGQIVAWLSLTLVLISALVVVLRYGFNTGSIAMQEAIMYNHAMLFMLGIAYTYLHDQHVRVDVFYSQFNLRQKAWVNFLGSVFFTLPVVAFILWAGWDYVAASWAVQEGSAESGGIGYLYVLKSLILILAGLLALQALAIMSQSILTLFINTPPSMDAGLSDSSSSSADTMDAVNAPKGKL